MFRRVSSHRVPYACSRDCHLPRRGFSCQWGAQASLPALASQEKSASPGCPAMIASLGQAMVEPRRSSEQPYSFIVTTMITWATF